MFETKDFDIARLVDKFDQTMFAYEAKWGVDKLQELAPPKLAQKWRAHMIKLNDAIIGRDATSLEKLVDGAARGMKLLEQTAIDAGHNPHDPEYYETRCGEGLIFRIYKNNYDAAADTTQNVQKWTLQEVARVLSEKHTLINVVKDIFPEAKVTEVEAFDFEKGDNVEDL